MYMAVHPIYIQARGIEPDTTIPECPISNTSPKTQSTQEDEGIGWLDCGRKRRDIIYSKDF